MENLYTRLLTPPCELVIAEQQTPYVVFTERHLQVLWLEQKYFQYLTTSSGDKIEVLSPGIWNLEAGPDFLKAHLRINGQDRLGDIELHLNAEDWNNHKHDLDERYDRVILHVALWQSATPRPLQTSQGNLITQSYLEPCLTIPLSRIVQLIDLDLYPYRKFLGSGRCARALFLTLPENKIVAFFRKAASWRLTQKYHTLQAHRTESMSPLSIGMAMALGYKHNTDTFLKLFHWLNEHKSLGEEALFVLGLSACGFFKKHYEIQWGHSARYRDYQAIHMMLACSVGTVPSFPLVLHHIRPLNHPVRRLLCLAKVLTDASLPGRLTRLLSLWERSWAAAHDAEAWGLLRRKFVDLLPNYRDSYWNFHFNFEGEPRKKALPLLGGQIKQEIVINTVMPLLYEQVRVRNHPLERIAFQHFFSHFPAGLTGKARYLKHRFFGDTPNGELLLTADIEQGAYQLHRDFCLHYESSCEGCPFIDRYIQYF